ncbi:MAG: hypothetical protein HWN69_09180 [Desulfobacterales bacterium]|nr:hypothetical protein [Desulfobacterales bacterium]
MYTYGDIPDTIRTKPFWPLGQNLWALYKKYGFDYYVKNILGRGSTQVAHDMLKERLDTAIDVAKAVWSGEMKEPDKVLSYMLFPPVVTTRADLAQGAIKLMFGESTDMSFVLLEDISNEIVGFLNGHCENGIPVDWWIVGNEAEDVLDRRHRKYGHKVREMPQKTKNLVKCGERIIDILKDIRNERAPQWADSTYIINLIWMTADLNLISEPGNYEQLSNFWVGLAAKYLGLPEPYFTFVPSAGLTHTFMLAGMRKFISGLVGLFSASRAMWMAVEERTRRDLGDDNPELRDAINQRRAAGIPYPWQCLEKILPNYKKKETYEKELFEWQYPPGDWITPEDLGLTVEDTYRGVYLDIDHDCPKDKKATRDNIISMGIGKETEFLK